MAADDGRLERLEQRIAALEDQIAIYQLLMTYGPSADSGSDDVVRAIHHPDAEYDSGLEVFREIPAILASGGGAIVNCSSGAGLRGGPRSSAYYASKHAVLGMTKSVALEYAARGIRANAVCPGLTLTGIVESGFADAPEKLAYLRGRIPMGRPGQPDEVAQAVTWLCSAESSFITGAAIPVDGGTSV